MIKANNKAKLVIAEGRLINVPNLPTKQAFNKGQSNFWFDTQKNIIYFREGQKKEKSIQIGCNQGKYQYEGIISENIYEIIVRTSLFNSIFGSSEDDFVAVTEESMKLPFEEQPWFIGAVDKGELKEIEQAQTRMFFTRAKGPNVYLHWTTTKRLKNPERPILLESNDLSSVLPRGEFITARYNGGVVKYLHEYLFYRCVVANDFAGMKSIVAEKGVNFASPFLHDPNVTSYYIKHTTKEEMNEELVLWLIEHGPSLDKGDKELVALANSKCNESVVEALLQRGACCLKDFATNAMLRNFPVARLKIYWTAYCNQKPKYSDFMSVMLHYKQDMNQKKVLIMLAWRYGNEDNNFKILPKELVKFILSFDLGEIEAEQPWFEHALELHMNTPLYELVTYDPQEVSLNRLSFTWRYWNETPLMVKEYLVQGLSNRNLLDNQLGRGVHLWFYWLAKFVERLRDKYDFRTDFLCSQLLTDISALDRDLKWIKYLLDTGTVKKAWFTNTKLQARDQPAWYAINSQNTPLVKFYVEQNMLPFTSANKTLEAYLHDRGAHNLDFLTALVAEYKKQAELQRTS